jgi:hypothetical protein
MRSLVQIYLRFAMTTGPSQVTTNSIATQNSFSAGDESEVMQTTSSRSVCDEVEFFADDEYDEGGHNDYEMDSEDKQEYIEQDNKYDALSGEDSEYIDQGDVKKNEDEEREGDGRNDMKLPLNSWQLALERYLTKELNNST